MIRMSTRGGVSAAIALALAVTGCSSSAPSSGGDFGGGTDQTGGGSTGTTGGGSTTGNGSSTAGGSTSGSKGSTGATTGSTGANSNSGTASGNTGSNPGSAGPAPTSTSGSGSPMGTNTTPGGSSMGTMGTMGTSTGTTGMTGTPTGSPNQGGPNGIPTAQGFTTGPTATDLTPPAANVGIQFATPPGAYTVQPGQEIFPNYCVTVQNDFQVGGFQSFMTAGSSHHFILYNEGPVAAGTPDGTCSTGGGGHNWMYATSTPGAVVTENFPPNVGLDLPANTGLVINMHFINPGSTPSSPQVKLNLLQAENVMYQAGTMISFNVQINVPPATAAGPGTQTVSGTCTAPAGANFFSMSTHTHKHATDAWVTFTHNGQTNEIVHTGMVATYPADQEPGSGTDWEHPGVGLWVAPNYLTVQAGDSFGYNCSYVNMDSTTAVTVGETAASNEMCMAVGYYFPQGSAFCQ